MIEQHVFCKVHTDYESWQKEPPALELAPLFEVLWKDPWEPFYIARNTVPFYDERFKQYGFNRISQVYWSSSIKIYTVGLQTYSNYPDLYGRRLLRIA